MSLNPTSRVIAIVSAVAVAMVGLLPFQHMHADSQVVHRHVIGDGSGHQDSARDHEVRVDHPTHADVRILTISFETVAPFTFAGQVPVTALRIAEPGRLRARPTIGTTLLPTHDPPRRFTSSPAPPAVV